MSERQKDELIDTAGKLGRSLLGGSTRRRSTRRTTTARRRTSTLRRPRSLLSIPRTSTIIRYVVMAVIAVIAMWLGKGKLQTKTGSPEMNRMARTYRQAERVTETVAGKGAGTKRTANARGSKTVSNRNALVQDGEANPVPADEASPLFTTFKEKRQAQGSGVVKKVLRDDTDGSKHQKFILEDRAGNTLLISHNIDLAPRIAELKEGDTVDFCGEFFMNEQGGGVHWTHKDPDRRHVGGWLRHNGRVYE